MAAPRVVVTDIDLPSDGGALELLKAAGFNVHVASCATADEVVAVGADADALIVQWAPLTAAALCDLPKLRVISRLGIGVDMIDLDAATASGIAVLNTPDYCVEEVTSHTIALALSLLRALPSLDAGLRCGRWAPAQDGAAAVRPSETAIAVIGFGRIGSGVASALSVMGFETLVCDPFVASERIRAAGHRPVELDEALSSAELVSLHAPLTSTTRHLLDRDRIGQMKRGARIVNTCRGELIEEDALVEALADGQVGGAALDVFQDEPLPDSSPLRHAANVLLTPHAAWYSPAALLELPRRAAENIVSFLGGSEVPTLVNPEYRAAEQGPRRAPGTVGPASPV
jgi:phosphoglycerate dehydrogenase-like enzyme